MRRRHLRVTSQPRGTFEIPRTGDDTPSASEHSRLANDKGGAGGSGPATEVYVEVVAAGNGGFGKTTVPFAVADPVTGTCDQ